MNDKSEFFGGMLIGGVIGMFLGTLIMLWSVEDRAIDYGIAHYDSKTGDLVWHEVPKEQSK